MILITKWFGTFLCDEERIVKMILFPKDAGEISQRLANMQKGGVLDEERQLAEGQEKLNVADRRQSPLGKPSFFDSSFIRSDMFGYDDALMHESMLGLGRLRTSEPLARDKNVVQAIRYLDDLIETINLLNERLHEWYGMHFPELPDFAKDRRYSELIAKHGARSGVLAELGMDIESIGSEFDGRDMGAVQDLAGTLSKLYVEKERTESYISEIVERSAPNLCALLAGPLAARLISLAGGLERLATLPSSTIQLLGAEKAMFRHLRSGKLPPKHGVIYQHPEVHRAMKWQRGAIARALACKISIAARVDAFGGEFVGEELLMGFAERAAEIKKDKYDVPRRGSPKDRTKKGPGRRENRRSGHDGVRGGGYRKDSGHGRNGNPDRGRFDGERKHGDRAPRGKKPYGRNGGSGREDPGGAPRKAAPRRGYGFKGDSHYRGASSASADPRACHIGSLPLVRAEQYLPSVAGSMFAHRPVRGFGYPLYVLPSLSPSDTMRTQPDHVQSDLEYFVEVDRRLQNQ